MKKPLYTLLFIVLFTTNLSAQKSDLPKDSNSSKKTAPLNEILKDVVQVLNEVESKTGIPKPKKVSVTFQTESSGETGAGVNILIFKFGRKWSKTESSEVTYNFEISPQEALDKSDIKEPLAKAIKEAIDAVTSTESGELRNIGFTVKIGFTIERTTSVGAEYEISPVTPSLNRAWKKKAVHNIQIVFEQTPTKM